MGKILDITGQRFGRLTVVCIDAERTTKKITYWLCKCDCGNMKSVKRSSLIDERTKSCGCLLKENYKKGTTKKKVIGKKFGMLTVIEETKERTKCGEIKYLCKCDCGNFKIISNTSLRWKMTRSCGCLSAKKTKERATIHSKSDTRLYRIRSGIIQRCCNEKNRAYKYYGGRGITICDEWKDDFQAFYDWAMANGYEEHLEIDRIEVDGHYEPNNCRWVTHKENMNNLQKHKTP